MNGGRKVVGIVQARMGSRRLPGKSLLPLAGTPALLLLLSRLQKCQRLTELWVATTTLPEDDVLADVVETAGWPVFRGESDDVLGRFFALATLRSADVVVRLTGDCPFHDPKLVDLVVDRHLNEDGARYTSNTIDPTFPDGLDVEVFEASALNSAHLNAIDSREREHVTMAIHGLLRPHAHRVGLRSVEHNQDLSSLRWTLDTQSDYEYLCAVAVSLNTDLLGASWEQILVATQLLDDSDHRYLRSGRNEHVLADICATPLV
jgi:spore coat polysaccharide biosynthesis protein SpsF (cytidylyltransferase family)